MSQILFLLFVGCCAALASALANAAGTPLSTDMLDEVTAGNEELESVGTQPTLVAVDKAAAELQLHRAVELGSHTQQQATILNAVNGAQADVANAINIAYSQTGATAQSTQVMQT